jgi:hypothetical protein
MTPVNPAFQAKVHELTALAYEKAIPCPPLVALNDWLRRQPTVAAMPAPAARPSAIGNAPGGEGSFDEAVVAAVRSSPNGVAIADLQAILAAYKKPNNQIGAALGRLKRAGRIQERGGVWRTKAAAPAAARKAAAPKQTAGARRRGRPPRSSNGAERAPAENQPQAGAAAS